MSSVSSQPKAAPCNGSASAMSPQNAAAADPATVAVPAATGEVSELTAAQLFTHVRVHQAIGVQASAINKVVVKVLGTYAGSCGATEAANAVAAVVGV
jgi:PE family